MNIKLGIMCQYLNVVFEHENLYFTSYRRIKIFVFIILQTQISFYAISDIITIIEMMGTEDHRSSIRNSGIKRLDEQDQRHMS